MHKFVVNLQIPQNFKTAQDRPTCTISDEYESWIVKDQYELIWLSTISKFDLPRVMSYKHAFEVCDKIHQYFNVQMKYRVLQLLVELKSTKKGNK